MQKPKVSFKELALYCGCIVIIYRRGILFSPVIHFHPSHSLPAPESSQSFKGCISRVKFNDIYPLKRYYSDSPPDYVTSAGSMQKSRCRVEEEIPNAAVPEIPVPPTQAPVTGDPNPLPPAKRALAPGDQAAIACESFLCFM